MAKFLISWEIDVDAPNALAAVLKARQIQLDEESIANVFNALNEETGELVQIDLQALGHVGPSEYEQAWGEGETAQPLVEDPELMNGLWLVNDKTDDLYIIPVPEATREIEGPEGEILYALNTFCRNQDGKVTEYQYKLLGLTKIEDGQKRYASEIDRYYYA